MLKFAVHSLLSGVNGGVDEALGVEGGDLHGGGVAGIPPWPLWGLFHPSGLTFCSGFQLGRAL